MIIIHLIYLAILISVYYLPFVTIQYNMHTILPEHALVGVPARQRPRQPTQIQSTELSLDVMIYGVCGRQSRKTLLKIHENMEILRNLAIVQTMITMKLLLFTIIAWSHSWTRYQYGGSMRSFVML
jgi:hypothetical protein